MAKQLPKNESLLKDYLERVESGKQGEPVKKKHRPLPKSGKVGRPRKHAAELYGLAEGFSRYTILISDVHREAMIAAANKTGITIREAFAKAISLYLKRLESAKRGHS